jgi:hypothetical protein
VSSSMLRFMRSPLATLGCPEATSARTETFRRLCRSQPLNFSEAYLNLIAEKLGQRFLRPEMHSNGYRGLLQGRKFSAGAGGVDQKRHWESPLGLSGSTRLKNGSNCGVAGSDRDPDCESIRDREKYDHHDSGPPLQVRQV